MTLSERMFEKLCEARRIRFKRIIPRGIGKNADYRIWLQSTEVVVEVKQIDFSDHEKQLLSTAEDEDSPFVISDVVSRIRNKFDKAKKQLKRSSRDSLPALFVLFDNTGGLSGMDNGDFLNAMYGDETVRITIKNSKLRSIIQKVVHIFGGQRKVSPSYNRFVSGFCRMLLDDKGEPYIILFHNKYARIGLSPEKVNEFAFRQFELENSKEDEFRNWKEAA
jgi:hypothetical protein